MTGIITMSYKQKDLINSIQSKSWDVTIGTIETSEIEKYHRSKGKFLYSPHLLYSFSLNMSTGQQDSSSGDTLSKTISQHLF